MNSFLYPEGVRLVRDWRYETSTVLTLTPLIVTLFFMLLLLRLEKYLRCFFGFFYFSRGWWVFCFLWWLEVGGWREAREPLDD